MEELAYKLGDWMIYYCAIVAILFVVVYSIFARWWKTSFGQHLFSFMAVIALVFIYIVITKIFGRFHGWEYVRLGLIGSLATVLTWRVCILLKVQLQNRRK